VIVESHVGCRKTSRVQQRLVIYQRSKQNSTRVMVWWGSANILEGSSLGTIS
jgi:hypothetical protein